MCVLDYITWATIHREFQVKISIEQSLARLERTETLAKIERDEIISTAAHRHKKRIKDSATKMLSRTKSIKYNCDCIMEGMYYDILSRSDSQTSNDPNQRKRDSRIEVLKKVQGIEIRMTLGRLIAINALLAENEQYLESLKKELHETIMREDSEEIPTHQY